MKKNTIKIVTAAMLLAVSLVLNMLENILPPIGIPGVRLGLSNIPLMFALFYIDIPTSFFIGFTKSFFVFLTRGLTAFTISLGGFLLCFAVLVTLYVARKQKSGYLLYSVCSALAHNMGQLCVISIIYGTNLAISFVPILALIGVVTGIITAVIYKISLPILQRMQ